MKNFQWIALVAALAVVSTESVAQAQQPNIIFIMADDMGFGDAACNNPNSTIPTPNIDRLATEGLRFTDAHSPSAVCTPTRYGVLTGRYCWRTRLKSGVLGGYSPPLIDADRSTIATMLRKRGYHTAAIGKWHLGMTMPPREEGDVQQRQWAGDGNVNFAGRVEDGPTARGFDYYFGNSASLDMAPYVWIENDRFVTQPSIQHPGEPFPAFTRKGPRSEDFEFDQVLDMLGRKAAAYISERAAGDQPFFLYLPLTAPHKPVSPHPRFVGESSLGPYGDFVMNVDAVVGSVLAAIDNAGVAEPTLVVFTSDNGNFMFRRAAGEEDHVSKNSVQAYAEDHHTPNHIYRGTKADVYEAGHRVPLLVRWPGTVQAGSTTDLTTTHTDWYATFAEVAGSELADDEAEDSFSLVQVLSGDSWQRAPVINHSIAGMFAIREGRWKLIAGNGSGGREKPKGKPFERPYQLYDLDADPGETTNLIDEHPEIAERLEAMLSKIRENGRSR